MPREYSSNKKMPGEWEIVFEVFLTGMDGRKGGVLVLLHFFWYLIRSMDRMDFNATALLKIGCLEGRRLVWLLIECHFYLHNTQYLAAPTRCRCSHIFGVY